MIKIFRKKLDFKKIINNINMKNIIYRLSVLIFCLFINAIVFNLLQRPTSLVTGGSSGIAIILEKTFHFSPSLVIFVVSILMLIISFWTLGVEKTSGAVICAFVYPLFVDVTSNISSIIRVDLSDMLLLSIFIGIIYGIINGLVYKMGFSFGGISTLSQILYKYFKIGYGKTSFFLNVVVVLVGGVYFGWNMVMYACIILYISSILTDRVMIGVSKNKALYIITKEEELIKDFVINELKHGVTIFDVKGGYEEKKRKVIMTVVPTNEYFKLKEGIHEIDKEAFFIVTDSYQVSGGE